MEEEEMMQTRIVNQLRKSKPGLSEPQAKEAVKLSGTVKRRNIHRKKKSGQPSRKGIIEPVIYR